VRKVVFILLAVCYSVGCYCQEDNPVQPGSTTEQQLENLADQQEGEPEDDTYLQALAQYRKNKLDLNTAEENDLKELRIVTELQIQNFLRYRQLLGKLLDVHELQAIPTWDVETIQRILPFVRVGNLLPIDVDVRKRLDGGQHTILARVQQVIEKSAGFTRPDTVPNRYGGSPQRIFFRYKYTYRNLLQYGVVGEKDPGEQFFKGSQTRGFDFYSLHLFARKLGPVKLLALGDFTVNMGQGLIHWQSLAFKKSAEVLAVKRQADIIRPYNSAGEYNFNRGLGVTVGAGKIEVTAFASTRQVDATFHNDTSQNTNDFFSSILNSGYHRTPSEINRKNSITQTSFGGSVSYKNRGFQLGLNGVAFQFSAPLIRNIQPYNQFAIHGKQWHNYSLDYSYTYKNLHLFGEAAVDKMNSKAYLGGLLVNLDPKVDMSLVYRNIEKSYQSLYGNAFTETTLPTNEKGLYIGISLKPASGLRMDAYADAFSFRWLRYRVDAPSSGTEYFVQATYRPNKVVEVYSRYRNENKAINISGLNLPTRQPFIRPRQNWRTQFSYKPGREVTFRNRVELVWYDAQQKDRSQQGFLTYFDVGYQPANTRLSLNTRLQYFETEGYDSRIYAYESDVLYSFSIPQFAGKGMRYYINANYDVTKNMQVWIRWAQTIYQNQDAISSGLDLIPGNKKTEVKVQVLLNL
jgi:hypothetical protein